MLSGAILEALPSPPPVALRVLGSDKKDQLDRCVTLGTQVGVSIVPCVLVVLEDIKACRLT